MRYRVPVSALAAAMLLAGCGRPDASGVYLATSARDAALIQLSQDRDGHVTGRLEVIAIGPDGAMTDQSSLLRGAASRHELSFTPPNDWLGGAAAFTNEGLTVKRDGAEVKVRKASLADFQKAVAQLKARASQERRRVSDAEARQAAQAPPTSFDAPGDPAARLSAAAAQLRADAAKLDDAVSAAPDFGREAADNTARLASLASRADRRSLAGAASQLMVATSQIDIARTQYATGLEPIIRRAAPLATQVERFCETPGASRSPRACAEATSAATAFESAQVRAAVVFKGYKQAVQEALARQNQLAAKIGG